jgi:hypothetical protein
MKPLASSTRYPGASAAREERSDDLTVSGAPMGFAQRGERSRDLSPGRAAGPTKELER